MPGPVLGLGGASMSFRQALFLPSLDSQIWECRQVNEPLQHTVTNTNRGMYKGSEDTGVIYPTQLPGLRDSEGSHTISNKERGNTVTDPVNAFLTK